MNKPSFKAIERKVNLALCIVIVIIALGLVFSNKAAAQSMTDIQVTKFRCDSIASIAFDKCIATAKFIRDSSSSSELGFNARRNIVVVVKHKLKSSINSTNLGIPKTIKSIKTNSMPVIDEINPAFKKSRLI